MFADGTEMSLSEGALINDAVRFDGRVTLAMGDAQAQQAGNFQVTGRLNGGVGSQDVLNLSAYQGSITIDGRVGDGIGGAASSIQLVKKGSNFGGDTSLAVANEDGSFTYKGVVLTGGSGSGATADITVKGGSVSALTLVSVGGGYKVGDTLTAARSQIGDLVARSAADQDAWALSLQVLELSSLEGLVVSDALNVTFGERLYVDGDVTIQASGKVVFSGEVVLRGGGKLVIAGTQEVEFLQGIRFEKDDAAQAGSLSVSSNNTSVSFLYGLFAGQNDAMRWSGVSALSLKAPEVVGEKGSLAVSGVDLVLREAPGFANLNLNLDTLSLSARSLTMPSTTAVTVNMDLGLLDIKADTGVGAANAMLKVNANRIEARAASGDVFIEVSGSKEVLVNAQTRALGTIGIGAAQDLRLAAASSLQTSNLSLSAQRDMHLSSVQAQGNLSLASGRHMSLSGEFSGAHIALSSNSGTVTLAAGSGLSTSGSTVLTAGTGALLNLNSGNQFGGGLTVRGSGTVNAGDRDDLTVLLEGTGSAGLSAGGSLTVSGALTGVASSLSLQAGGSTQMAVTRVGAGLSVASVGAITFSTDLSVGGAAQFSALGQALVLSRANDFGGALSMVAASAVVKDINALDLGTVTLSGDLDLTSGGALSDSGLLSVGGQTRLSAAGQSVSLDNANDFVGALTISAASAVVRDNNALNLGAITLSGDLSATAGGALSDSGVLSVGGQTRLSAAGQSVTLDSANDFVGALSISAASATLTYGKALGLGAITLSADLNLTAGGALSGSGVLSVGGQTRISASGQTVTLDSANDFVGALAISAASAVVRDTNALDLGTITLSGDLDLTAGGAVSDSGVLSVGGQIRVSATGQSVTLDSANDFVGAMAISAASAVVRDINALDLGTVTLSADLGITAGGAVSDSGVIQVAGAAQISAASQSVVLDSANNFVGALSINAASATVKDSNALDLGTITLSGELSLIAGGTVSDSGVLSVGGQSRINAAGQSITLDSANDFVGALSISAASAAVKDSNALDLGTVTLSGDLSVTTGGALSGSGVLSVGGQSRISASGQSVVLDRANDFAGAVSIGAASALINDVNALDLAGITVSGDLTITVGGAVSDSGVLSVGGQTRISAAGQSVRLDSSSNFGGAVSIRAASALITDVNALDLGTVTVAGDLEVTAAGAVTDSGAFSVGGQTSITAAGQSIILDQAHAFGDAVRLKAAQLEISRSDSLRLPKGSLLQAPSGSIVLRAASDLWTSGLSLSAVNVLLDAGQAIKAEDQEDAQPLSFDGALRLQARTGIGGFGFQRVLLDQLGSGSSLSGLNSVSGDVVIAGQRGLTLSAQSLVSNSDGWMVLLGGRGAIEQQGQLIVRPNFVRATGITWMDRSQIDTWLLLSAALKSGALLAQPSSPLERMNQLLAQGWVQSSQPQEALDRSAQVMTTESRHGLHVGTFTQAPAASLSVMAQPKSSSQLMDMAMTLTRQGSNPLPGDAESISGWVVRTTQPASEAGREAPVPRSESAPPAAPGNTPGNAPAADTRPAPSTEADKPAEPAKVAPDAPAVAPNSDVRWLLPQDELLSWVSDTVQAGAQTQVQGGVLSGLKSAALKLSQWLGWSDAPAAQPPAADADPGAVPGRDQS